LILFIAAVEMNTVAVSPRSNYHHVHLDRSVVRFEHIHEPPRARDHDRSLVPGVALNLEWAPATSGGHFCILCR
jgi:hypothetical protein